MRGPRVISIRLRFIEIHFPESRKIGQHSQRNCTLIQISLRVRKDRRKLRFDSNENTQGQVVDRASCAVRCSALAVSIDAACYEAGGRYCLRRRSEHRCPLPGRPGLARKVVHCGPPHRFPWGGRPEAGGGGGWEVPDHKHGRRHRHRHHRRLACRAGPGRASPREAGRLGCWVGKD